MGFLRDTLTFRSIGPKIALLIALILGGSTLVITLYSVATVERALFSASEEAVLNVHKTLSEILESEYRHVQRYREQAMEMRREQLMNVAASVRTSLDRLYHAADPDNVAEWEANRRIALDILREVRYFNNDYFFTYDRDMTAIAHPDRSFEGRNLIDFQDPSGKYVLREIRDIALEQGEGFIDYLWVRLDQDEPAKKLGYVFHHPHWDWIIGSGVYIDDIEAEAQRMQYVMRENLTLLLDRLHFAKSGLFFILDSNGKVEVSPHDTSLQTLHEGDANGPQLMRQLLAHGRTHLASESLKLNHALLGTEVADWEFHISHFAALDWYLVSAVPRAEIQAPGRSLAWRQLALNTLVLLVGLGIAAIVTIRIISRLRMLATHARMLGSTGFRFASSELERIGQLRDKSRDEVGELAEAFLVLERELQSYIQNLTETTSAKERIESELRIAHDIQMGILPKLFPAFPDYTEFDIYASILPAREVGGDLYDFFFIDEHRFCFVIGDVSGKGVPAAFFMAVTKTLFKAVAEKGMQAGEILNRVNNDLASDNDSCMFVTLFTGIIDIRTGLISYASAGHNPPVLLRHDGNPEYLKMPHEPVAGAVEGFSYSSNELQLYPGDLLLLYTDGVTEAMDETDSLYGDEHLIETIRVLEDTSPVNLIKHIMSNVAAFSAQVEQSDDITMLALQFKQAKEA